MQDVLEAIVGDIPTLEDKAEEPPVVEREDGSYLLDGMLSVEDLKDLLALDDLPDEVNSGYETLGGMLMAVIGRIPKAGETVNWSDWRFEVVDMDGYRVDKVLVSRKPTKEARFGHTRVREGAKRCVSVQAVVGWHLRTWNHAL